MPGEEKEKKENKTMSNLEKFLNFYGNYVAENNSINMDIDTVIHDVSTNIIEPNSDNPDINRLYQRGATLKREVGSELTRPPATKTSNFSSKARSASQKLARTTPGGTNPLRQTFSAKIASPLLLRTSLRPSPNSRSARISWPAGTA